MSGSLRIWPQLRTHFKHRQAMPSHPISANALFPPSLMDTAFKLWFQNGLKQVKDLFKDGVFMSFEQLVNEYNIPVRTISGISRCLFVRKLSHIRAGWEEELGFEVSDISWQSAIKRIHSTSICIRHGLLQFKVLHRLSLSRSRLARICPDVDPTCSRCRQAPATLYHIFWACPKLIQFWSLIFDTFSYICD